jgi:alkanesulfonate monooxygenase SsuD/methylene tetrahydromethanopterin reductase-like flavin-dependent oxidoreductase (luciferase family)
MIFLGCLRGPDTGLRKASSHSVSESCQRSSWGLRKCVSRRRACFTSVISCGTDFESRGRRADEQLAVLRALWDDRSRDVTHHGEFFQFGNVVCSPKPVAGKRLPVHIGGHSKAAARRAGRFGDGFQPLGVTGAQLDSLLALMRDEAAAANRDPADIEVSLGHSVTKIDAERAERLAAQGADRLVLAMPPITDLEQAKDELSACAQRLSLRT